MYSELVKQFAQTVNLYIKNDFVEDIDDEDGQKFVSRVVSFLNQYKDELENVTDPSGQYVYWSWLRDSGFTIASVYSGGKVFPLTTPEDNIAIALERPVRLVDSSGNVLSTWSMVRPEQLREGTGENLVARMSGNVVFSREISDGENGADVTADVVRSLPPITESDDRMLGIVKPYNLMVLGVVKNMSLADQTQSRLSPSFTQKYNDLLQSAINVNNQTTAPNFIETENYSYVRGVGV